MRDESGYITLPDNVERITVDTVVGLETCMRYVRGQPVVGVDCEWCPTSKVLALLQLATLSR